MFKLFFKNKMYIESLQQPPHNALLLIPKIKWPMILLSKLRLRQSYNLILVSHNASIFWPRRIHISVNVNLSLFLYKVEKAIKIIKLYVGRKWIEKNWNCMDSCQKIINSKHLYCVISYLRFALQIQDRRLLFK